MTNSIDVLFRAHKKLMITADIKQSEIIQTELFRRGGAWTDGDTTVFDCFQGYNDYVTILLGFDEENKLSISLTDTLYADKNTKTMSAEEVIRILTENIKIDSDGNLV